MRIGFTGASGFIGSYLSRSFMSKGLWNVRLLLRSPAPYEKEAGSEVVRGDLVSPKDCERFAAGLDVIIYLAHCHVPVNSDLDQSSDALLNMVPLLNLLQAIQVLKTRPHVVYFSSGGALYRPSQSRTPYRETDVCEPCSSYGIQKLAAEHYLRLAAGKGHLTCTVLRVGNAYGTLLPQQRMQGLIGVAINSILHAKPVRIFGSMENIRDYVHLDDVVAIIEKAVKPKEPFTILNVGSGQGHSVKQVLSTIEDSVGASVQIEVVKEPEYGRWLTDWVVLDITKAQREFDWAPGIHLQAGIRRMVADWGGEQRSHPAQA